MSVVRHMCWSMACDICGDGWTDRRGHPHFESRDAVESAARSEGWVVTPEQQVCGGCLAGVACALVGHDWGPWTDAGPFPSKRGGSWEGSVRHCRTCSAGEWDPPIKP